ncbi:YaiO family outer membrane beta-barrel protein [Salegentibacter chungangensis]|uniref:YaiO family outer membrane beta-barrel protein n=1 Tax=Salegentibacter chungangensis TaxID=1335724 RepID=A0ABW3NTF0_9FLAO
MRFYPLLFLLAFQLNPLSAQVIEETNTDEIYEEAVDLYRNGEFNKAINYTQKGLELAPGYHDIRVLQIRNYWALKNYDRAEKELLYLMENAPEYPGVLKLVYRQISYEKGDETMEFLHSASRVYPRDAHLQALKSDLLFKSGKKEQARALALKTLEMKQVSSEDKYLLQTILKRTIKDEIGVIYQYLYFSDEYSRNDPWHSISAEYKHSFNRTVVLGRVNYTDRSYDSGSLYELEAYPVFNDRLYAYLNAGVSDGSIFPDFRGSASVYYNFAKALEAEAGGRLLHFSDKDFFTGILGLSLYTGNFYLNLRSFLGPERKDELVQNYQFNVRYYLSTADNYLFTRLGSGISPDERTIFTQVQNRPDLNVYYINAGINHTLGVHHVIQLTGGYLFEDINSDLKGNQFIANIAYHFRF